MMQYPVFRHLKRLTIEISNNEWQIDIKSYKFSNNRLFKNIIWKIEMSMSLIFSMKFIVRKHQY